MDTTDNRSIYNKTRKEYLERKGLIHCSWCAYHNGDNMSNKMYGSIASFRGNEVRTTYPNWKLVSKNKKQWMVKPIIHKKKRYRFLEDYYSLEF